MPQLVEVLAGLLRDVTNARAAADSATASLVESYKKNPILRHFPVPRAEIKEVSINLRFSFASGDKGAKGDVVVDSKNLHELQEHVISTLNITVAISNYDLLEVETTSGKLLVERDT